MNISTRDRALAQPVDYRATLTCSTVNVIVQHCQGKWESVTACREFQTEEATMPSDVESRQPREGFTWASIQGGHLDSLLYTLCCTLHHHALPVSLLRGQGKPRALSKNRVVRQCQRMTNLGWLQPVLLHGWRWWAASPSSACVCLSSYRAFCLVQAVMHMYSNKRGGICYGSCCNTANIWKWEGIHQCHKRN